MKIFPNLEYLFLKNINFEQLSRIIDEMMNLRKIDIEYYTGDLDLVALNKKREHLIGTPKLRIYIPVYLFFETEWTSKNGDLNLSSIETRRLHS